ncbi:hypothetical protein C2R22_18215 [Salinigranum rubrum]|uniref:Ig-like domain-containing protein n=1 Tax=Salinigranum rubrum TaxID=755307 RepID=A0A2I8VQD8_9EURY|nr:hypothetical protein [Salinigranum rubrum]AUV83339.1 hypothetical protein C2R22_18215 [Salinigranum rubrum]
MTLYRRRLLALLATTVAGCGETTESGVTAETPTPTPARSVSSSSAPSGPRVRRQSVSVGNPRAEPQFVTVAVEYRGSTAFVESLELVPGERRTVRTPIDRGGTYDVVVETANGDRATYRWEVVERLDGLAVTLTDGIGVLRTVRCGTDCRVFAGGERLDEPLVGDGSPRWYAPAQVVLRNPGPATEVSLSVALDGEALVDARYRVDHEAQVVVPLTYRSGTYRVAVEVGGERVAGAWRVPEEPSRVVDVSTLAVGCGPANSQLRVRNADGETHAVTVTVERGDTVAFEERFVLEPGGGAAVVPVDGSGRYEVGIRLDGGPETRETWWSCPPNGPAAVVVDATGGASLQQTGL